MANEPSPDAVQRDLAQRGVRCLYCSSEYIEGGPVEIDSGGAYQRVTCADCGQSWTDTYTLTGVTVEG